MASIKNPRRKQGSYFSQGWEAAKRKYPEPPFDFVYVPVPEDLTGFPAAWFSQGYAAWCDGVHYGKKQKAAA